MLLIAYDMSYTTWKIYVQCRVWENHTAFPTDCARLLCCPPCTIGYHPQARQRSAARPPYRPPAGCHTAAWPCCCGQARERRERMPEGMRCMFEALIHAEALLASSSSTPCWRGHDAA